MSQRPEAVVLDLKEPITAGRGLLHSWSTAVSYHSKCVTKVTAPSYTGSRVRWSAAAQPVLFLPITAGAGRKYQYNCGFALVPMQSRWL